MAIGGDPVSYEHCDTLNYHTTIITKTGYLNWPIVSRTVMLVPVLGTVPVIIQNRLVQTMCRITAQVSVLGTIPGSVIFL